MTEWQRLADLGSSSARCVLAYVHFMGTPTMPADLEEARRIALTAVSGARGYANYLVGCIALREKQPTEGVKFFLESIKAGFVPAATHLASITVRSASAQTKQNALKLLRQSAAAGHRPALLRLAGAYLSGKCGFSHRAVGLALLVPAFARMWFSLKYKIFSIQSFQVVTTRNQTLFNENGIRGGEKTHSVALDLSRKTFIRWTHAIAATTTASVLVTHSQSMPSGESTSALTLAGWASLAALPYVLSYWIATNMNVRSLVSTLVQTMSMCLVTTLVCSAYLGQLFESAVSGWEVPVVTVVQSFFLLVACGLGENAARQVESTYLPTPLTSHRVVWAHLILGLVAAGSWLSRSTVWHLEYLKDYGFNLASYVLLAMLPYVTSAVLSWRLVTANRWKPWVYVGILAAGTALAVVNNSGIWTVQPGLAGIWIILFVQFISFLFAAEWVLDDTEW